MSALNTLMNNRYLNKYSERIAWILAFAILLLVLLWMAWSIWSQHKLKQTNYQPQKISPIQVINKPTYKVKDIVSANLFGDPKPSPVVKVAPKTTLNLTLEGLLWSSDNSVGRAIITSGKKKADLYSVGEKIKDAGAIIEEIRNDEVILNRNGALESLTLNKKVNSGKYINIINPGESSDIVKQGSLRNTEGSISKRKVSVQKRTTQNNRTSRIRRPNFSGLDQALKKIGDL